GEERDPARRAPPRGRDGGRPEARRGASRRRRGDRGRGGGRYWPDAEQGMRDEGWACDRWFGGHRGGRRTTDRMPHTPSRIPRPTRRISPVIDAPAGPARRTAKA